MASDKITELTKANWDDSVKNSGVPVLVDFWAAWCGPCRMIAPILDEIAEETTSFKIGKVDVDSNTELASEFGVMSIPTLILFKNGEEKKRLVGAMSKQKLLDDISSEI